MPENSGLQQRTHVLHIRNLTTIHDCLCTSDSKITLEYLPQIHAERVYRVSQQGR